MCGIFYSVYSFVLVPDHRLHSHFAFVLWTSRQHTLVTQFTHHITGTFEDSFRFNNTRFNHPST
jgi:hypothetical protein